jgi:hypothetical protein
VHRVFHAVAAATIVLGAATHVFAQATLRTGLGGPRGYGTNCMPPSDDGSWPASTTTGLDITAAFPSGLDFFGTTYTQVWINNNGSLSFTGPLAAYTPKAFPFSTLPIIAPYLADVDTRTGTTCTSTSYPSGGGYPAGATCMNPSSDGVWWAITPGQLVVTWDQVGFYACHASPVMTFQLVISAPTSSCGASRDYTIEFRYNQCGWEVGDASGGTFGFCSQGGATCTPAQAGFQAANETDYETLPDSLAKGISTEVCTASNLSPAQPGVWQFAVRGGGRCPNTDQVCATGKLGVCSVGQVACASNDQSECVQVHAAGPSQCNGLDNDCDGVIDTGPCPTGTVCNGTACVAACGPGTCPVGQTCTDAGACVANDCLNVTCPAGESCVGGACVDRCSGVICPIGLACHGGVCADPCAGIHCSAEEVCENGECTPSCPCNACAASQTCETSGPEAGHCVATACATVACPSGQVCQSGACVDVCTGAVCPTGQTCTAGACVACGGAGQACCAANACESPQKCGGGGTAGVCGCTAATVCPMGQDCGSASDTCGGTIICGVCGASQTCSNNQCVIPVADAGVPSSDAATAPDAGTESDASIARDAGITSDASTTSDAAPDGETGNDAGGIAGSASGSGLDASVQLDSGSQDAAAPEGRNPNDKTGSSAGCGCRVALATETGSSLSLLGFAAIAFVGCRRRRPRVRR